MQRAARILNGVRPAGVDDNNFSAASKLLPYIEQGQVYKKINYTKPVADDKVRAILECFTLRGAFDESPLAPYAVAPGMRLFEAPARAGVRPD